jgi:hypothetical protein
MRDFRIASSGILASILVAALVSSMLAAMINEL